MDQGETRDIGALAVAEARLWLGTPYKHQTSTRGAGTDCLGLLRGVWRALYGREPEVVPAYTPDWSEPAREERLWEGARRHMIALEGRAPLLAGEVLLFRMREGGVAKHLAILTDAGLGAGLGAGSGAGSGARIGPRFIHAYTGHGVVETALTLPWQRRIVARFQFPEGAF